MTSMITPINLLENSSPGTWWGMQLDFAIAGCAPGRVRDALVLRDWVTELVKKIGMTAYGEPRLVHFGEGDATGWTVEQLITTSNITAHFNDFSDSALITVFSCRQFDPEVAVAFTVETFEASVYEGTVMHRYVPVATSW